MHRTRSPHYMEKSRSFRLDRYVSLRSEIARDRHGMGVFRSHHYLRGMPGSENVFNDDDPPTGGFECSFLSLTHAKQGVIYHADFQTPTSAAFHMLTTLVHSRVDKRLEELGLDYSTAYGHVDFSGMTIFFHPDPPLPQLGGQTVKVLYQEEWGKITPSDWHLLTDNITLNFKKPYGVEITAIVPYEGVNLSTVLDTIERFRQLGERPHSLPIDWNVFDEEIVAFVRNRQERGERF